MNLRAGRLGHLGTGHSGTCPPATEIASYKRICGQAGLGTWALGTWALGTGHWALGTCPPATEIASYK